MPAQIIKGRIWHFDLIQLAPGYIFAILHNRENQTDVRHRADRRRLSSFGYVSSGARRRARGSDHIFLEWAGRFGIGNDYRLEIGLYYPPTMERVGMVDVAGKTIGAT